MNLQLKVKSLNLLIGEFRIPEQPMTSPCESEANAGYFSPRRQRNMRELLLS